MRPRGGGKAASRICSRFDQVVDMDHALATEPTLADRERLMMLGADLQRAWTSAGVTPEARKRIVRTLIDEIVRIDLDRNDVKGAAAARRLRRPPSESTAKKYS